MPKGSLTQFNQRLPDDKLQSFTGTQLKKSDPKRYASVTKAIKEGLSPDTVAKIFGINRETAQGIMRREELVSLNQDALKSKLTKILNLSTDTIEKALEEGKIEPGKLFVGSGIVIDKLLALHGQPSTTIRHEVQGLTPNALHDLVNQCKDNGNIIEAEVVPEKS